jgi:broad specificity phosphatase PhoE
MTRIMLIYAGPTPWELEGRLVGNQSLPLTEEAHARIAAMVEAITEPVTAVYRAKANEACDETARIVATKFKLRPRDNDDLNGLNLGLWQGLTIEAVSARFPTVFAQWEKTPLSVTPPEGESLEEAIARLRAAVLGILRRNRDGSIALPLRPVALRIVSGILRRERIDETIASIRDVIDFETIELNDEQVQELRSET